MRFINVLLTYLLTYLLSHMLISRRKFTRADRPRELTAPSGVKRKRIAKYSDFGPFRGDYTCISETVQE